MIDVPTLSLTLPSSGLQLKFRTFKVKEEKLILLALESGEISELTNAVLQVIDNCLIRNEDEDIVKLESLPYFDIDYIFVMLRASSVGGKITQNFKCNNIVNDNVPCGAITPVDLDISNLKVENIITNVSEKAVWLSPDNKTNGFVMEYPNYRTMKNLQAKHDNNGGFLSSEDLIAVSVKQIISGDKLKTAKLDFDTDYIKKNVLEDLTLSQYKKVEDWVLSHRPVINVHAQYDCPKCGFHHELKYDNLDTFFL